MNFLPGWQGVAGFSAGNVATGAGAAAVRLSNDIVSEAAPIGTTVGLFSVTNATGTPAYTLVDNAGGMFSLVGDQLQTAGTLDYSMASSYQITVAVAGVTPAITQRTFTITVTEDVSEVADVVLSNDSFAENSPVGTVVGTFSLVNATGTPTYTLVDDAEGTFTISGANLQVARLVDLEGP